MSSPAIKRMQRTFWLLLLLIVGCGSRPQTTPSASTPTPGPDGTALPRPTLVDIPTLLPTFTPVNRPTATATRPLQPSPIPSATVTLSEVVMSVEFSIPGLGMTRTLTATFASRITLSDAQTGLTVVEPQQSRILLELQSVLDGLSLDPIPDGCDLCPRLRYELPVAGQSGDGWLTDPVLLASLENYFAIHLGPHWPPNTVLGLRRSASVYRSAQTVAFTADGQMWRWSAIDSELALPETAPSLADLLPTDLDERGWADSYQQECRNVSRETLLVVQGEQSQTITFRCPEITLPDSLTPLYAALDGLMAEMRLVEGETNRVPWFPYTTAIYYQRADGYRLALDRNGSVVIASEGEIRGTGNLTATLPISLTAAALDTDLFTPGTPELLRTLTVTDATSLPDNFLMVRGETGPGEITWDETVPDDLAELVATLDALINDLVGIVPENGESEQ